MVRDQEDGVTDARGAATSATVTPPGAVVAVVVPRGKAGCLPRTMDCLGSATGPAGLCLAPGALAVLILSSEPDAVAATLRVRQDRFPHPLRLHAMAGPPDDHSCIRLGARVARLLGAPHAPVFILDARCAPGAGWLYWAAAALRDGATVVRARRSLASLLGFGPAVPRGVSVAGRDLFRPHRPLLATPRPRLRPAVV